MNGDTKQTGQDRANTTHENVYVWQCNNDEECRGAAGEMYFFPKEC